MYQRAFGCNHVNHGYISTVRIFWQTEYIQNCIINGKVDQIADPPMHRINKLIVIHFRGFGQQQAVTAVGQNYVAGNPLQSKLINVLGQWWGLVLLAGKKSTGL